jgi:hypothetical protein
MGAIELLFAKGGEVSRLNGKTNSLVIPWSFIKYKYTEKQTNFIHLDVFRG